MKKIINLVAAAAIAASLSMPTVSADPGKGSATDAVAFCKDLTDAGVTSSVGECMGILRSDDAPQICKNLDFAGLLEAFGFKNRGQCVSFARSVGI